MEEFLQDYGLFKLIAPNFPLSPRYIRLQKMPLHLIRSFYTNAIEYVSQPFLK